MTQNQELNNTCIFFDKDNIAQQEAIIRFYNENGWEGSRYLNFEPDEKYIGVYIGTLGTYFDDEELRIIDLPKEYYHIDNIVEDVKSEQQFFEDLLLLISIDVQNELLHQCKKSGADDYQTDLINENVVAVFELNKQKYLNLIYNKIKRK